ncbi:unnamed protein product [Didymodactylos carnosus]|uniref:Uncharacterized protein n=1 Tax=Didymodactylos carnosus TaxID=1234261 RepID=A0A815CLT8_9BILA|nr:unnamed protein product [Didymodactylos carnosus]CAF1285395.1 unnamed protein product [Didymodactylos carnosus]CAF3527229.1 unnamed protein product [Didymodactylos carnosus]CAF4085104.1 unnamed protein product [Didymodactylos carnosus]
MNLISKIKLVANDARKQVSDALIENNHEIMKDFVLITNELKIGRQTKDYVETNLNKWRIELDKTEQEVNSTRNMWMDSHDSSLPPINMIKIKLNNIDQFGETKGSMQVKDNNRIALHSGGGDSHSSGYGTALYSKGVHRVSFKIEKMYDNYWIFFGITSSNMPIKAAACLSRSAYGWAATSN